MDWVKFIAIDLPNTEKLRHKIREYRAIINHRAVEKVTHPRLPTMPKVKC